MTVSQKKMTKKRGKPSKIKGSATRKSGTHEFHTMGIRALKPNCVKSLKKRARIFGFTLMAQNITLCVKLRIF